MLSTLILFVFQNDAPNAGFAGTPAAKTPKVEIAWNRLYDYDEIYAHLDRTGRPRGRSCLAARRSVTASRTARCASTRSTTSAPDRHASRSPRCGSTATCTATRSRAARRRLHGVVPARELRLERACHELVDRSAFYLLPMVNPDGRANWLRTRTTRTRLAHGVPCPRQRPRRSTSTRTRPTTSTATGTSFRCASTSPARARTGSNPDDPRILERVPANDRGIRGDWIWSGLRGHRRRRLTVRINEDGVGGYDMNRAWPSMWMPGHVQYGAGPYPLYWPETRCIARFLYEHPNVAGVCSRSTTRAA